MSVETRVDGLDVSLAAQMMPGLVWIIDMDGRVDWSNDRLRDLVGFDLARGHHLKSIVHPEDHAALWEMVRRLRSGTEHVGGSARIRTQTGEWRWHVIQHAPASGGLDKSQFCIGTATDINAQTTLLESLKRDNEELEQDIFTQLHELNRSRARLQTIFDACPDYLYVLRLSKGGDITFEDINPAAEILYSSQRSNIIGRNIRDALGSEQVSNMEAHVHQALRDGRADYQVELRNGEASSKIVQIVCAPLAYSNEEEGLVLFCGRDMTEQRAAEEALRQSQKMEAVGQLTGGLAHDFNNLLTGIMGGLDLLQMRVARKQYDRIDRYLEVAREGAARAAALTHRLLAFSRRQTLDPKPRDANRLIVGMSDLLQRTGGPEIEVALILAENLWTILVDASQLENALLNLFINARDAMSGGGHISITTTNIVLNEPAAREQELSSGDYVILSVDDDGIGMLPEVAARIFDPFFTTKPIGSGTGLGLSMIYGFARQSGGNVRVKTRPGHGTTMQIFLPRHMGQAREDDGATTPSEAPHARRGETILLVDDDQAIRAMAAEMLADLGYEITLAVDGVNGVEHLQSDRRFDALITDVGMPGGLNGRQVAETAQDLRPGIKILFITGYAENGVFNHDLLAPGMQVLNKPFDLETLARRLRSMLDTP